MYSKVKTFPIDSLKASFKKNETCYLKTFLFGGGGDFFKRLERVSLP